MAYHFTRNEDGTCDVYDGGRLIGGGVSEAAARQVCLDHNRGKPVFTRPARAYWVFLLLGVIGLTLYIKANPPVSAEQAAALELVRDRDAAIIKACRNEGVSDKVCAEYRREVRKLEVR